MKKISKKAIYLFAFAIILLGGFVVSAYYAQQPDQLEMFRIVNNSITDSKTRQEMMLPPFKYEIEKVKALFR